MREKSDKFIFIPRCCPVCGTTFKIHLHGEPKFIPFFLDNNPEFSYFAVMKQTFYKVNPSKRFYKEVIERSVRVEVQMLDCSVSHARLPADKPISYLLDNFKESDFYFFVVRESFPFEGDRYQGDENYIEAGFCIGLGVRYFLYCFLKITELAYFIEKYNLEEK